MKRKTKRDIGKIIQTMLKAHDHATLLLQNKRIDEARELLAQCQDCAIHVGETIEKSEGMDTQAVFCIEEYCEQLYNMWENIGKKKNAELKRCLDDSLKHVICEINKLQTDKLKVVFMPYKASMWDCMESVWEAAQIDDDCEVYVVPIPYYERNENVELQKLCYEGDVFPDYVPVTHYTDFLLEIENPDIIYIHNPYDGANYVTSVHPDYYSHRLKDYVDKLVYIPYYITGKGEMNEAHRNLPVYKYIDKIIVQDQEKAESLFDYLPKDKIIALGSPKVDRILKLNDKKQEIIEHSIRQEWKEKIKGKKVVLFNISISGILKNSKYALDKIRYVLSSFEHQEDIVLLWRPHPLIEATLKSMRPEMYEEYIEIKNTFIKKGRGIFDETEDAGIASIISDAYIGEDSSSLVHYFGVLGKPVFYTNWRILEDTSKNRDNLYFNGYFFENNEMFFVPSNSGYAHILFKLDIESGMTKKVMEFPGNPDNVESCYYGIKKIQNKIILIPYKTEDIYIYDIDKKQGMKIVLSLSKERIAQFSDAVEYKDKVFLIPGYYPAIISINIKKQEVCEFQECIRPFILKNNVNPFSWPYLKKEQYLYLASIVDSRVLIFNMEDGSFVVKKIGNYPFGYCHMLYDGEYFWLSAYKVNCIVKWDEDTGETEEYSYPLVKEQSADAIQSRLLSMEEEIVVCPGFSANMIFINKKTGQYRYYKPQIDTLNKMEIGQIGEEEGFKIADFLDERTAMTFIRKNCSINIWDIYTDQWKSYLCRLPKEEMLKVEKRQIEKCSIIKTTPYCLCENDVSISQFSDYIVSGDVDIFKQTYECYQGKVRNSTIGASVHEYIKNI